MDADFTNTNTNTAHKGYVMHDLSVLLFYLFFKGNEYTHILSAFQNKQPSWTLTYSQSHYIISLKEAKMHFNKTRCSATFDLFLRWPQAPDLSNANASDSAGSRARPLPAAGGQRWIFIYTSTHERIHRLSVNVLADLFNLLIFHSLSSSFFPLSPLFPSINVKKRKQTSTKSTRILFCMSVHYIILSSLQAPMLPSYGQSP